MFLLLPQPCDDSVRAYIPDETPGFPNKSCFHSFRTNCSDQRSEEHTYELQSLMRISYAVFCLKKKTNILSLSSQMPHSLSLAMLIQHLLSDLFYTLYHIVFYTHIHHSFIIL